MKISKRIIFTLMLLMFFGSLTAQDFIDYESKYSFIQYDKNKIDLPGDSLDFLMFLKKLDNLASTGRGNLNIVHFGGSHVQADMWTRAIREDFNRFLNQKQVSRGFIFPYKAVKTNGNLQFDISYNKQWEGLRNVKMPYPDKMGLMGWSALAKDSGQLIEFTLKNDDYSSFFFDKLRIFHDTGETVYPFSIEVDSMAYMSEYNYMCNCTEFEFKEPQNHFILTVHKMDSLQNHFTLYGVQTLLDAPGLTYTSVGINGASVNSYLKCDDLEDQLALAKPDLIVFSIGINDAFGPNFTRQGFENDYEQLIKRIRKTCPDAPLLFTTNTDSYFTKRRKKYLNYTGNDVKIAMYNMGIKYNAAVWDLYTVMGGLGSISTWKNNGMAQADLIHFNNKGYRYLGDLFFDALLKKYDDFLNTNLSNLTYE